MRVLVVAPHPDDEVLGCGGVMARHAAAGDQVHVIVVTRGHADLFPPESVDRVRAELREAHTILGVNDVTYLEFPAPRLDTVPRHTIADAIAKVIKQIHPELMYMPHHGDMHFEHGMIYEACLVATRPIHNQSVKRVLTYETPSETEWAPPLASHAFIPTVFVDIAPYLKQKLAAMACFKSQLQPPPHPRSLKQLDALASVRGATAAMDAAEAFMLVREIIR